MRLPTLLPTAGILTVLLVAPTPAPTPAAASDDSVDHVLLISVDGLNPDSLTQLGPARTPGFHRLMAEGAGTLNARTLFEETRTLPNHSSMLTGIRAALPRGTGVRFNDDNGTTLRRTAGRYVPGVFDVVHDHGGTTAMYVAKEKFRFLNRSWNARYGAPDRTGANDGRDKIDRFVYAEAREDVLVARLVDDLRNGAPTFTFLHLAEPDRVGHRAGGMSARYLNAVRRTDALLGKVLASIDATPSLRRHLLVILTSDHGTNALDHSDPTKRANYRIPFYAWGPGVAAGAGLYASNPERRPPGRGRPSYRGEQPIRNGDVANLVTDVLDLPRVPGSEFDVPRTLDLG